jgi:small subunit ribosomal protein S6
METRNYETVFIANPHAPDQKVQDINARNQQIIESMSGKILHLDDWGKKKMAYPIRKEAKGHYFCLTYKANTKAVAELERNMRINEDVFRFLTVKIDEKVDPMQAIEAYKRKLEAHAKREKERAERDAERNAERASFRGPPGEQRRPRGGPPVEHVEEDVVVPEIEIPELGDEE